MADTILFVGIILLLFFKRTNDYCTAFKLSIYSLPEEVKGYSIDG